MSGRHFAKESSQVTRIRRERELSQQKCLPSKHQDPKWIPRSHIIKLDRLAQLGIPMLERKRKLGSWGSLARQPSERPCLKNTKVDSTCRTTPNIIWGPHAHAPLDTHAQACRHAHMFTLH